MKIVVFANTTWYIYNFRRQLIQKLMQAGHVVHVVAPRDAYTSKLTGLGIACHHIDLSQRGKNVFVETRTLLKLYRLIKMLSPRTVLSYTVKCNLYAGLCRYLLPFDLVANVSGLGEAFDRRGVLQYTVSKLYRAGLRKAKRVFFQNSEDMKTVTERGLLSRDTCKRLPGSGIDLNYFCPELAPVQSHGGITRFLMYGRLVQRKGYDQFIAVADRFKRAGRTDAEFWIMGMKDETRKESMKLFQRVMDSANQGIISFVPPRDDVREILKKVDVVVLPSVYNEGVPRSILEAMAFGKPIVTSNWKGCRDTTEHNVNGYLTQPGDVDDLFAHITKLVEAPAEQLRAMGMASRQKAKREFDEQTVLNAYMLEIEGTPQHETPKPEILNINEVGQSRTKKPRSRHIAAL
jgi:glycosyltransferase involved in cell wall biosynthesis